MEAILFYGDQDEATRRQVRSVAAQYSHRIGPRKRKKSKLPKQSTGLESKHGHFKKLTTASASDVGAFSSSSSGSHQQHPFQILEHGHYIQHAGPQIDPGANVTLEAQQQSYREHFLHREYSGSSSEVGSEPTYSPHTPQLAFGQQQTTAPSQSPESHYRRLPAYTWTEYPRYAVTGITTASPQNTSVPAIATRRLAFELPDPTVLAAGQNAPRSHPMDMPPKRSPSRPQQSPVMNLQPDHMLPQNPLKISGGDRAMSKEENAPGKVFVPPTLQISRCVNDAKEIHNYAGDHSQWRGGKAEAVDSSGSAG